MNVLLVFAHPELRSLNGAMKDYAVSHLKNAGHAVQVSDLYRMQWKSSLDIHDSPGKSPDTPYHPVADSRAAYDADMQSADINAEQEKIRWADMVILQFPLWWFSMPAILKGWIDRVYSNGFAYGVGEHSDRHWGDRYGEGNMKGKRAMLLVTIGGWASHYGPRGVNGPIEDILFPINHGILFYPGFDVLPPFVVYRADRIDDAGYHQACQALAQRLDTLFVTPPIAYRQQNAGDYHIPELMLKPDHNPGERGFAIHIMPDR